MNTIPNAIVLRSLSLALSLPLVLSACSKHEEAKPTPRPAMMVQPSTASLTVNNYAGQVTAWVQPQLGFRVGGKIIRRVVDQGSIIKQGEVLAELDPLDLQLQLKSAQAGVASAESAERVAKADLERYRQLLAPHAISQSQFDQIDNQYKSAASSLEQARSQLKLAENQMAYTVLRAPQDGVIMQRQAEAGQVVTAGQPIYTMAAKGDREVVIGLPEQDASRFRVGQSVVLTIWSQPDVRYPAHIRQLSPASDQSRTFEARIAFNQANPPVDIGQSARAYIVDNQRQGTLTVPLSAVTAEAGRPFVWVLDPAHSTIKRTFIQTGTYGLESVPVLSGLSPDDWLVSNGVQLLRDGQEIQPVDRMNRPIHATAGAGNARPQAISAALTMPAQTMAPAETPSHETPAPATSHANTTIPSPSVTPVALTPMSPALDQQIKRQQAQEMQAQSARVAG